MKTYRVLTTAYVVQYVRAYDATEAEEMAEQSVRDSLKDYWDMDADSEVEEDKEDLYA